MRAKFIVNEVSDVSYRGGSSCQKLTMAPVTDTHYKGDGENEDNTFARYTPSGEIRLSITNPNLKGEIEAGDIFYIDFIKAEK